MITTLTGPNAFARKQSLDFIRHEFEDAHGDISIEQLDGEEASYEAMQTAVQNLPFLSTNKLVILFGPSANKQFIERAETLLSDLPDTTEIVLVEPKLDKRSSYYKFLKASTDFRELAELDNVQLAKWIQQYVRDAQGRISVNNAHYLIDRIGPNQRQLQQEIDKLRLVHTEITHEAIEAMTEPTPQSTVFQLLDAVFRGDAGLTQARYQEQRLQRIEPQQIIALLAWQLHVLALIKSAGKRTPQEIAQAGHLNPYVVRKSIPVAQRISRVELQQLLRKVRELDMHIKSTSVDADIALQTLLLELAFANKH